jgi:dTDP-4-dehydrorhamnose 3,5-epimerase
MPDLQFIPTSLRDAYIVAPEKRADDRGFFARTWCQREFAAQGLETNLVQCNVSFNHKKGTLRGMHWQLPPFGETKLVRCTQGAIYDVIIDLRPDSPSFEQWVGVELTAANGQALYVPQGFAHGFQTLTDNAEVYYQMSTFYEPGYASGLRWNDPKFPIDWPAAVTVIADRDRTYADYQPAPGGLA